MRADIVGAPVDAIPTPALVLDLDRFEQNVATMADEVGRLGVSWRPHAKAHGNATLARVQVAAGAIGVTCATVAEAVALVAGGIGDILIANEVIDPTMARAVAELESEAHVLACVDSVAACMVLDEAARRVGSKVPVLIEVDIGLHRAGVRDLTGLDRLAREVDRSPGLELRGVMGYEGHTLDISPADAKRGAIVRAIERLIEARDHLLALGRTVEIVSCGGTGSYRVSGGIDGVTEVQAGGGCLNDRFYAETCNVPGLDFALSILTTVISRPEPDLAIIDAGAKAMSVADGLPLPLIDGASLIDVFAEHGRVRLTGPARSIAIGDRLACIPGYSDSTTVLHRAFVGVRQGVVESILPRPARDLP